MSTAKSSTSVAHQVLLATPFRLFFVLAGVHAGLWIPLWLATLHGYAIDTNLGHTGWHAHEMVFGYSGAVLAGFLLTAAQVWTRRPTVAGMPLLALLLLWAAGRATALHGLSLPAWLPLVVDGLFWLTVAAALARAVIPASSWRNLPFVGLTVCLGIADIVLHLHLTGDANPITSARAMPVALDAIALFIFIFGGRIIPMFTGNAIAAVTPRKKGALDWLGLGAMTALLLLHAALRPGPVLSAVAVAAGALNAARLWGWGGRHTLRTPILWVLHVGWLLLAAGIALEGAAGFVVAIPRDSALHLQTTGGIGLLTLGMMARVSLGHTGRPLQVPTTVAVAFVCVVAATVARVGLPWLWPPRYHDALYIAGGLWAFGFLIFSVRYAPILLSPRVDGKPG